MRPVFGLRPDRSSKAALLAFAAGLIAATPGPAWASTLATDQIDGLIAAGAIALRNQDGTPFRLSVSNETGDPVTLSGRPVGNMTAVWVETERGEPETDFRAVVDVLPIPVWVRDAARMLRWGNRAFLAAVARDDVNAAIGDQASIEKTESDLAAAALAEGHAVEAKRFAVIGGQRRALALTEVPITNGQVIGAAIDVTDVSNAEARLQQHIDA